MAGNGKGERNPSRPDGRAIDSAKPPCSPRQIAISAQGLQLCDRSEAVEVEGARENRLLLIGYPGRRYERI